MVLPYQELQDCSKQANNGDETGNTKGGRGKDISLSRFFWRALAGRRFLPKRGIHVPISEMTAAR